MSATTLKQLDPTQVELEITITPEEFDKAQDSAFRKLVRTREDPGLPAGQSAAQDLREHLRHRRDRRPGARGPRPREVRRGDQGDTRSSRWRGRRMEMLPEEEGQPLRFKAVVAVRPPIEPAPYEGIEIEDVPEQPATTISSGRSRRMRKDAATLVPVDRPVQLGDTATIDYEGKIDGVPFEGGTATGAAGRDHRGAVHPRLRPGIVGMKAGETRGLNGEVPGRVRRAELAGKDAVFTMTVHEVKEPELPPLDDEFAKRVSAAPRRSTRCEADVRGRLDAGDEQRGRRQTIEQLLDKLAAKRNEVPLPQVLVEREIDALVSESQAIRRALRDSWDDYLTAIGKTEADFRVEYEPEAPETRQDDPDRRGDRGSREDRRCSRRRRSRARCYRPSVRPAAGEDPRTHGVQHRCACRRYRAHQDDRFSDPEGERRPGGN